MLKAPLSRRRAIWPIWSGRDSIPRARSHGANRAQPLSSRAGENGRDRRPSKRTGEGSKTPEASKPSLIEQLFPEETKRYEEAQAKQEREIPRMPLEMPGEMPGHKRTPADRLALPSRPSESRGAMQKRRAMELQAAKAGSQTSVLVLLNASKNLTEEDFTRLIPQGRHMEGWTLEDGDILKVIPGRNMATLEQENFYYLLFSSPLSAFVYQGHATRIARLAAEQTPDSLHTALAPTPGYMLNGMDVYAAIQAYTLTPPTQTLNLRQLRPPLSPLLASLVKNGGYSAILNRPDKMPYEVRLTLEGPQIPIPRIRHVIYESGRDRALGWSGGEEANIKITKYQPRQPEPSPNGKEEAAGTANFPTETSQLVWDMSKSRVSPNTSQDSDTEQRRRVVANPVYILGFHTEHAAQSFIRYWHRRPMDWGSKKVETEGDLAPVANAELLW